MRKVKTSDSNSDWDRVEVGGAGTEKQKLTEEK